MNKPAKPPSMLSVGDVAHRSGLTVSTLHFYEAKGLIAAQRNGGNQRRYTRDILRRLAIIKTARSLGFQLTEIEALLAPIPAGKNPTASDVKAMIAGWQSAIQERINGLTQLRDRMEGCIGCGCLALDECPLRNPNDILSGKGTGAILLQEP